MNRFLRRFGWLARRAEREDDLRAEIEFHLSTEAEERHASGLADEQARMAARRELGNIALVQEDVRAVWGWTLIEQFCQDVRYAVRTMASNRTFTVLAALSLALGIGANTAIYSFMESILLRPLPVPDPHSLVVMKWRARGFPSNVGFSLSTGGTHPNPKGGIVGSVFSYPALELFQSNSGVFASTFCYFGAGRLNVTIQGETEAVEAQYVSGDYFRGMGVPPAAGRLILAADDYAGAAPAVVLNYRYSQRHFGEASDAVGQSIRINGKTFTVAGVAPPKFFSAEPGTTPALFLPMHANLLLQPPAAVNPAATRFLNRNYYWVEIMGRLKPGVSLAQAQTVLGPQFRRFAEDSASNQKQRADLPELTLLEGASGLDSLRFKYSKPLYVLMTMAGLILLIACANIANLLLARAMARRREIAVRLSIGAGRLRIIRQLLTESVLLASFGGALGVAFAFWIIRFLTLLLGIGRDGFTLHAELNWQVLSVTLALSIFTGLLFGVAPAIQATRVDVMPALKEVRGTRLSYGIRPALARVSLGQVLMTSQMVFSLVLLVGAGLLARTLANLHSIELGFTRENVLLFGVNPRLTGYEGPALRRFYDEFRERLSQIPGVRSVSLSERPLLSGTGGMVPVTVPGATPIPPEHAGERPDLAGFFSVGPAFFKTMQIPLVAGREFDERDVAGGSPAIVNSRFAKVFGLSNPVGRTFTMGKDTYEIIGLVADALFLSLKENQKPMVYTPLLTARPQRSATYEMRAAGNPLDYAASVRQIVRQMDSRLAVSDMKSQAAHIDQAISQEIALARLCMLFAGLALTIACVGLYGTVALNVARRTGEIGIRMALGAQRAGIVWLVLRGVFTLAVAALAIGVPLALAGSRVVESFLYGIKPRDALTATAAVVVLLAAALVAGFVPARRASRIDPMAALRHE